MDDTEYVPPYIGSEDEFGFSELEITRENPPKTTKKHLGSIKQALEKHNRFVLLGDPGASKTTTLRRLTLESAKKRRNTPNAAPIPILLYLPQWREHQDLKEFVRASWVKYGLPFDIDPIAMLISGDAFLYMDGLNEMGASGVNKTKMLRTWFASDEAPMYVIVTCRSRNYQINLGLGLPIVQIEPMNEDHIVRFVKNYLKNQVDRFLEQIFPKKPNLEHDSERLVKLAKNPYMLAALIIIYLNSPDEALPKNNGILFSKLVKALAKREDRRQTKGWKPFEEKYKVIIDGLTKLAFTMIKEDKGTEVSLDYAIEHVGNIELVEAANDASYVELKDGYVKFKHQLIQEYFSGLFMLNVSSQIGQSFYSIITRNKIKEKWRQTFIAFCGLSTNSSRLIEEILASPSIDVFLASDCVTNGVFVEDGVLYRLIDELLPETRESDYSALLGNDPTTAFEMFGQLDDDDWGGEADDDDDWGGEADDDDDWGDEMLIVSVDRDIDWDEGSSVLVFTDRLWEDELKHKREQENIIDEYQSFFYARYAILAPSIIDRIVEIGPRSVPHLLTTFGAGAFFLTIKNILKQFGDNCSEIILKILQYGDDLQRKGAVMAIGEIQFSNLDKTSALNMALYDNDIEVIAVALQILKDINANEFISILAKLLSVTAVSEYTRERICDDAAEVLDQIGTPVAIKLVEEWKRFDTN